MIGEIGNRLVVFLRGGAVGSRAREWVAGLGKLANPAYGAATASRDLLPAPPLQFYEATERWRCRHRRRHSISLLVTQVAPVRQELSTTAPTCRQRPTNATPQATPRLPR